MSDATTAKPGDLDTDLLRKILIAIGAAGANAPRPSDNKTVLLMKWLNALPN